MRLYLHKSLPSFSMFYTHLPTNVLGVISCSLVTFFIQRMDGARMELASYVYAGVIFAHAQSDISTQVERHDNDNPTFFRCQKDI